MALGLVDGHGVGRKEKQKLEKMEVKLVREVSGMGGRTARYNTFLLKDIFPLQKSFPSPYSLTE